MQSNAPRRVHGAEFKAKVLDECRRPGASVAAVALAHGLNANLVRKWLLGRGMKRTGLALVAATPAAKPSRPAAMGPAALQFMPVDLAATAGTVEAQWAAAPAMAPSSEPTIRIALARGELRLDVCWPASQASACGAWVRELLAVSR